MALGAICVAHNLKGQRSHPCPLRFAQFIILTTTCSLFRARRRRCFPVQVVFHLPIIWIGKPYRKGQTDCVPKPFHNLSVRTFLSLPSPRPTLARLRRRTSAPWRHGTSSFFHIFYVGTFVHFKPLTLLIRDGPVVTYVPLDRRCPGSSLIATFWHRKVRLKHNHKLRFRHWLISTWTWI